MNHDSGTTTPVAKSPHGWRWIGILVVAALTIPPAWTQPSDAASDNSETNAVEVLPSAVAVEIAMRITGEVETLRELAFKREVPIRVIDDDEARTHMVRRLEKFQTLEELEQTQRSYELLGLLPEGFDLVETILEVLREQAGGFYDPDSGAFFVLDDIPSAMAPVIIAHELTHALEDQHFDLDKRLQEVKHDDDRVLARSAIHEGSATLLMTVYTSQAMQSGELDAAALLSFAELEQEKAATLDRLPPVFRRQLLAPYLLGSSFLVRGDLAGVMTQGYPTADINRVYADPPQSSEQILHPEKYWDEGARDEPRPVALGNAGRQLGRGWYKAIDGTLGELTIGLLVGAATPIGAGGAQQPDRWTNEAASGWDGDRWELWEADGSTVVLMGAVWDSPADAEEFVAALAGRRGMTWKAEGSSVALIAGDAGDRTERVLNRILKNLSD